MLICAGSYKVLMCSHNITSAFILLQNNRKIHYATNLPPLPLPWRVAYNKDSID